MGGEVRKICRWDRRIHEIQSEGDDINGEEMQWVVKYVRGLA